MTDALLSGASPYIGVIAAAVLVGSAVTTSLIRVINEEARSPLAVSAVKTPSVKNTKGQKVQKPSAVKSFLSTVGMLARPVATCAAAVALVAKPEIFLNSWLFPALRTNYAAISIVKALPSIFVGSLHEAFEYGALAQDALSTMASVTGIANGANIMKATLPSQEFVKKFLELWNTGSSSIPESARSHINSLLAEASKVAGGRVVSLADLLGVVDLIAAQEGNRSIVSRILGIFSFVNIMWFVSIIGLTAFALPFVIALSRPFGKILADIALRIADLAYRAVRFCWYKVLVPAYYATRPLIETLFYYVAFFALVESIRYQQVQDRFSMVGIFTGITGVALFGLSWAYSLMIRSNNSATPAVMRFITAITNSFLITLFGSQAIAHDSTLIGYLTVALLISQMGFSADFAPLCAIVGFRDKQELIRTAQGCLTIVLCYLLSRAANMGSTANGMEQKLMRPFESAVSVLGTTGYLMAVDIATGINYRKPTAHLLFIGSVAGLAAAGNFLLLPGVANTATVFGGIYLMTLYCSVCNPYLGSRNKDTTVIWTFGFFLGLYFVSGYLSKNPSIVVQALTGGLSH